MPDPADLQAMIDAMPAGGVLTLPRREFQGNFVVRKPIEIRGQGPQTVLVADPGKPALSVESHGVRLRLLSIEATDPQDVALQSAPPHGTLLETVGIVGSVVGIAQAVLDAGRVDWGLQQQVAGDEGARPAGGPIGRVREFAPIEWTPNGPFGDVPRGALKAVLGFGGAVPSLVVRSMETNPGGVLHGTLHFKPLAGGERDVVVQFFKDGTPDKPRVVPARVLEAQMHTCELRAANPGIYALEAQVNGIGLVKAALLTHDLGYHPAFGPDDGSPPRMHP